MDSVYAMRLLDTMISNISRVLSAGYGADRTAGATLDVARLLREEAILKGYFLSAVAETLADPDPSGLGPKQVPRELTEYVSYHLGWNELPELAINRISAIFHGDALLASSDVATSIIRAHAGDWLDRELFELPIASLDRRPTNEGH